jgi:hypothetical protein
MLFISKMLRDFSRRDAKGAGFFETTASAFMGAVGFVFGLGAGLGIAAPAAALLAASPLAMLATPVGVAIVFSSTAAGAFISAWTVAKASLTDKHTDREFKGIRFVGSREDIGLVVSSTIAIENLVKDFSVAAEIPRRVERKVTGFIGDMAAAAARTQVFLKCTDGSYAPVASLPITRKVISRDGKYSDVEFARLKTNATLVPQPAFIKA